MSPPPDDFASGIATDGALTLTFALKRDWLATVEFYASLGWAFACAGWLTFHLVMFFAFAPRTPGATPAAPPAPLLIAGFLIQAFLGGAIAAVLAWRRFNERLELDQHELRWRLGYAVVHVPLETIQRIHPIGIVRITSGVTRGIRLWFNRLPTRTNSVRNPTLNRILSTWFPPNLIVRPNEFSVPMYFDFSIQDSARFLEELATRCPHLEGDGTRLDPRSERGTKQS